MTTDKDPLERLRDIVAERKALDDEEYRVVKALRERGWQGTRWDTIAAALGISRQAVMKRHAQRLADEAPNDWHHRRRWDAGRTRST